MSTFGPLIATCPRGLEPWLLEELVEVGVEGSTTSRGAIELPFDLDLAYRILLEARLPSRLLVEIARGPARGPDDVYALARETPWERHFDVRSTFAVRAVAPPRLGVHTRFLALRVKDAVADRFRDRQGRRPDVDPKAADIHLFAHVSDESVRLGIDLGGGALHRRGYRAPDAPAPLRENVAAAILRIARWPARASSGAPLVDPFCGSGTILIEAACMAAGRAPGLRRPRHGVARWLAHDAARFEAARRAAIARERPLAELPRIVGRDVSASAVESARASARRAGVLEAIELTVGDVADAAPPEGVPPGIVVTNPPYGERLSAPAELIPVYETLGDVLRRRFGGYVAFVLSGSRTLERHLGLRVARKTPVDNGKIPCRLLEVPIDERPIESTKGPGWRRPSPEAEAFGNRLRKNLKQIGKWAAREKLEAYRLYDRDIPEMNVAVDVYGKWAHVQEHERPRHVDEAIAERRLADARRVTSEVLAIPPERVVLKVRRRYREGGQVEARGEGGERFEITEGGLRFVVNLTDRLDTGIYLDHRIIRRMVSELVRGKRFLNLFAYTCTATVYAAAGGAEQTTSVDLSRTYLDWGAENLARNGLAGPAHELARADCLEWLADDQRSFDVILLNPPVYSRSKGMRDADFDVVRDHVPLIRAAAARLSPSGVLFFSTHARRFELDAGELAGLRIEDVSERTVPRDFARSPHVCYRIVRA